MNERTGRLSMVVDNETLREDLSRDWGFSCHIETQDRRILFDTGSDPLLLVGNMERMGIDPAQVDMVVLSHAHWDHVGGLAGVLGAGSHKPAVVVPRSFPDLFFRDMAAMGLSCRSVDDSAEIAPGVFSTGEMGRDIPEQALVVQTGEGLVVVTGCAHPGVVEIVTRVNRLFHGPFHLLIGGFHLMEERDGEVRRIANHLEDLGVGRIGPCHCTGEDAIGVIGSYFGERYLACGAGLEVPLSFL